MTTLVSLLNFMTFFFKHNMGSAVLFDCFFLQVGRWYLLALATCGKGVSPSRKSWTHTLLTLTLFTRTWSYSEAWKHNQWVFRLLIVDHRANQQGSDFGHDLPSMSLAKLGMIFLLCLSIHVHPIELLKKMSKYSLAATRDSWLLCHKLNRTHFGCQLEHLCFSKPSEEVDVPPQQVVAKEMDLSCTS